MSNIIQHKVMLIRRYVNSCEDMDDNGLVDLNILRAEAEERAQEMSNDNSF